MSNQAISINNITPIIHANYPVLTTELIASLYQTEIKNIQQNYLRNQDRFIEGKHYFKLSGVELSFLRTSQRGLQISPKTRNLILWTERGAARHAKMLDTDQAWEVFERLEDCYFEVNKQLVPKIDNSAYEKVTVNKINLEYLIHYVRDALNILERSKAHIALQMIGCKEVNTVFDHLLYCSAVIGALSPNKQLNFDRWSFTYGGRI